MSGRENRFIPGIYNYCDYWCERCAFTRRCRNFDKTRARDREVSRDVPTADATCAAFWEELADKLRETLIFGREHELTEALAEGLDTGPEPERQDREDARRQKLRRHGLCRLAEDYMQQAGAWLESADADLRSVARGLLDAAASPFTREDVEEKARQIGDMIEVVAWYHTFIPAKIRRAVAGLLRQEEARGRSFAMLAESCLHDANGSGKVALVAIERSIAAWLRLREILPRHEPAILNMLAILDRLRRGLRAVLPGAESFRRPGFDGEPEAVVGDDD